MPEPDDEPEDDGELLSDDELAAMFGDDDEDDVGSSSFTPDSAEDLTELMKTIWMIWKIRTRSKSFTPEDDDEYEDYDDLDPDDIPDPDPIPSVYAGVDGEGAKAALKGLIISLVIVLLLGGLFGGGLSCGKRWSASGRLQQHLQRDRHAGAAAGRWPGSGSSPTRPAIRGRQGRVPA